MNKITLKIKIVLSCIHLCVMYIKDYIYIQGHRAFCFVNITQHKY